MKALPPGGRTGDPGWIETYQAFSSMPETSGLYQNHNQGQPFSVWRGGVVFGFFASLYEAFDYWHELKRNYGYRKDFPWPTDVTPSRDFGLMVEPNAPELVLTD